MLNKINNKITRAAQQLAAKSKKDTKKPTKTVEPVQVVDDEPKFVKEVKLQSMDLNGFYPHYSKWIDSQFQLIKDRNILDIHTGQPLWSKIYP